MKLLIASDIHGSAYWCRKLMNTIEAEQPDRILLLGDLLYHGPRNDLPRDYCPKEVIPMLSSLCFLFPEKYAKVAKKQYIPCVFHRKRTVVHRSIN